MQRAGLILAPRIFSTGEVIYGAKAAGVYAEINGYDDALAHVRRLKAQGAHSVKNYNQPRRDQRQMVVRAAQSEGMTVVPEGGRSEEHTSELQSLMRISYAVCCLKQTNINRIKSLPHNTHAHQPHT